MCAADSDFMGRLYKKKLKIHFTDEILFHRRIHNENLTKRGDTPTGYCIFDLLKVCVPNGIVDSARVSRASEFINLFMS